MNRRHFAYEANALPLSYTGLSLAASVFKYACNAFDVSDYNPWMFPCQANFPLTYCSVYAIFTLNSAC